MNNSSETKISAWKNVAPYLMWFIVLSLAITSGGWYLTSRIASFALAFSSSGAAAGFYAEFTDIKRTPQSAKGRLVLLVFSFIGCIFMAMLGLMHALLPLP